MLKEFKLVQRFFEDTYMKDSSLPKMPINHFVLKQNPHQEDEISSTWEVINNDPIIRGESTEGKLRVVITKTQFDKLFKEGLIQKIPPPLTDVKTES
jgi:hypothetical protein